MGQFEDQLDVVKFVAVVDDDTDPDVLNHGGWVGVPFDTHVVETKSVLQSDYAKSHGWDDYAVYVLVDLQTMQVLHPDCQEYPEPGLGWILPCVRDHLTR
ncbi:MAG: hypothetical protein B7733_04360 [Myxococcales bacterium FL481]|nr:MAG: hypothetical protein B7733_04360 [Myxococcales bacterium FL481]